MVCEICWHENSQEASFCSQCGKPMDSAVAAQEVDVRFAAEKEKTMQLLEQIMNDPEQMQRFTAFRASQAN